MPLHLLRADLTKLPCDAVVVGANSSLRSGGSVFGAVSSAAGAAFESACESLGGCAVGEAKCVTSHDLPCKYIILTAAPRWNSGSTDEIKQLAACYRNSLALAAEKGCKRIAFGLIDSGVFGYPPQVALDTATEAVSEFLETHDLLVYLVIFDWTSYDSRGGGFLALRRYIDSHYEEEPPIMPLAAAAVYESEVKAPPKKKKALPLQPCPAEKRLHAAHRFALPERSRQAGGRELLGNAPAKDRRSRHDRCPVLQESQHRPPPV